MNDQLKEHIDRSELAELVAREVAWLDGHRYDGADRFFTEDVRARTPGGEVKGLEALVALATKDHERFERTSHQPTGIVVDLDGDTAAVSFSASIALVEHGGETSLETARYRLEARRAEAGWRFSALEVDQVSRVRPPERDLVRELADRAEITELIARSGLWLDEQRWDETGRIFTDDVFAKTPGGEAKGLTALAESARTAHAGYEHTHHAFSNIVIDLDGDTASVRSLSNVVFALGDGTLTYLTARYRHQARRTEDGWRFSALEIIPNSRTTPLASAD